MRPTLQGGEINDPIVPQSLTDATSKSVSSTIPDLSIVQVQVALIDLMALGMPATTLPQTTTTSNLSTGLVTSKIPPDIGVAPVISSPFPTPVTGEIAFIDSSLPDYQSLVAGVCLGVTVVILEGDRDGISQITKVLSSAKDISAIHLISPGDAGVLNLGVTQLTTSSFDVYGASLQSWISVTPNADILLYGSNARARAVGTEFMQKFSQLTSADIAASANPTGSKSLGGDWNLEKTVLAVNTDDIAAKSALAPSLTSTYSGVFTSP